MKVQTLNRTPLVLATALLLAATAGPALAQTSKDAAAKATTTAKANAEERDVMKLSQDGFQAMHSVRAARLAIFDGNPQAARDLLAAAKTSLQAASKEAPVFMVDVKTGMNGKIVADATSVDKADVVPIDGQIVLADSFIDTPAKKAHIDKADQQIAAGRKKDAIDELKLAEVDASFSRVLMPLQATARHIDEASKLVDNKKYYEANLALKAAEDGLRTDSITLSEVPKTKLAAKSQK